MTTQCNATKLTFHELDSREVVGRFDGGEILRDPLMFCIKNHLYYIDFMFICLFHTR